MAKQNQDLLDNQVTEARRTIASDGYPMSVGEITNLYRDGELIIRPEFQRFFRWTNIQKSRLIESLLLGIPLPSIFVAQQQEGKWELVDGLQRISTILELQGELLDNENRPLSPLVLEGTKFLPALEGKRWKGTDSSTLLSQSLQLDIKRAKIDINIIKRESSPQTKYDLFQRLNSYGTSLTAQELRTALLVAASPQFVAWLQSLATHESFVETVQLSDRLIEEKYDLELVLRFIILHNRVEQKLNQANLRDLPQLLDDESVELAISKPKGSKRIGNAFRNTFDIIAKNGGEKVFRRWDKEKKVFVGGFLNTAFEIFALGIGYHIANGSRHRTDLIQVSKTLWARSTMGPGYATGRSTEARLSEYVPLGRKLLAAS